MRRSRLRFLSAAQGRLFKEYLVGDRIYSCSHCGSHSADHQYLISKDFQGRLGRAYLFSEVVNVSLGQKEERMFMTGLHTVRDARCSTCGALLGWKYEISHEAAQKYKEGKYILEKQQLVREEGSW